MSYLRAILVSAFTITILSGPALAEQPLQNLSIDSVWMYTAKVVQGTDIVVTEQVAGSDIPNQIHFVELRDGVYAPIGIRKPPGEGPFPTIVFAHMNGGMGLQWIREWTQNGSWTLEQFIKAGYAVVWMRYRAEVDSSYGPALIEGKWQGRQIFNRGPFEYDDAISIIEHIKTLDFVETDNVGYMGLSHGAEMLMKICSEYHGLRVGIASEPASIEYLARRLPAPDAPVTHQPETMKINTKAMQKKAAVEMRKRLDLDIAMQRINAINTPVLVLGRDRDHNQAIFRLNYELLLEAGKDVMWKSYDHDEHGFIFVKRNMHGDYAPDAIQIKAVNDSINYFDRYMKEP